MRSTLEELWHGNISPETVRSLRRNSESTSVQRSNTPEMKRLMEYMAQHHNDLITTMTDGQKDILSGSTIAGANMRVLLKNQFSCMRSDLEQTLRWIFSPPIIAANKKQKCRLHHFRCKRHLSLLPGERRN